MKKSLLIIISTVLILTSCTSVNGIKKEKIGGGLIRYSDAVTETILYEHPDLVSNPDSNKFNIHKGADSENINAFIQNGQFFLEASYECKSAELLRLNSIIFIADDSKLTYKRTRVLPEDLSTENYHYEELINPYFSFTSVNNYSYENFKVMLTTEDVENLSSLLEYDTVYITFVGERGRTDLFKLSKKVKFAIRSMIEKYEYLLYGEPEPEPQPEPDITVEEENISEEQNDETESLEPEASADSEADNINEISPNMEQTNIQNEKETELETTVSTEL